MTGLTGARDFAAERRALLALDLAPVARPAPACSTPASRGRTPTASTRAVWKSTNGGASWTLLPAGTAPGGDDSVENYCDIQCSYDNVDRGRPDTTRTSSSPPASSTTTCTRIAAASSAPTTAARPGRTSAGTCIRTSTRSRSTRRRPATWPSATTAACWTSDRPRRPPDAQRRRSTQTDWRAQRRRGSRSRSSRRIATNPASRTRRARPLGVWGGTQDNGTLRKSSTSRHLVRRDQRRRRPGARRPDRLRTSSTAPTSASRRTGSPTAAPAFFTNQSITHGINLGRPLRVLHPVGDEPGEPEPALPGHLPRLPHRQRQGAVGGRRDLEADQPRPDTGCTGPGAQRRAAAAPSRRSASAAARRSTPAPPTGYVWASPDAQTADTPTWTQDRAEGQALPQPAGRDLRGRPLELPDRLRRATTASTRRRPKTPGPRLQDDRRRRAAGRTSRRTCRTPRSTRSCSTRPTRTRSTRAPTSGRSSPTTAARTGADGLRLPDRRRSGRSTSTRAHGIAGGGHARPRRVQHGRRPHARRRSCSRRSTPASRSARRALINYTMTLHNIGNAAATERHVTDPVPDEHDVPGRAGDGGLRRRRRRDVDGLQHPAPGRASSSLARCRSPTP